MEILRGVAQFAVDMSDAAPRVLCVDDEPNVLAALSRTLEPTYSVTCATNAPAAIALLKRDEPFEVVISDMRMPDMDGAAFLTYVREHWPETVRVLLTGHADTESAIAAVNGGAIFRYLSKPCSEETLLTTMKRAVEKHHEARTERMLLETTLSATVKTLADILSLSSPWAFRRASLARSCVSHALSRLKWPLTWIYECAAALSQIGCIGVPEETLRRETAQRALTASEARMMEEQPETAYRLLRDIPRLDLVAEIVRYQMRAPPDDAALEVKRGSQLLHAALTVGPYLMRGNPMRKGLEALRESPHTVDRAIFEALADFRIDPGSVRAANIADLIPGWVLGENVSTTRGQLLLSKGHELSEAAIYTLRRLKNARMIVDPIYVQMHAV